MTTLPKSFIRDGFEPIGNYRNNRRLLIGSEGETNTGKTEFILSAPNPGILLCMDRGIDSVLDNPNPPKARHDKGWAVKVIQQPLPTQASQAIYLEYWKVFYDYFRKALDNPDALTLGIDGDSDSWELQRMAEFGKVTQVPQHLYPNVNAARRAMIARAWDSKKIIIATNKLKDGYKKQLDSTGKEVSLPTGRRERQGFPDQTYLWHIQIRHLYKPQTYSKLLKRQMPAQWGLRILKCKSDTSQEGVELWGEDCNFAGLVQTIYPNVSLKEWGF